MPPTALMQTIDAVRKRARVLSIAYGVGIVVAGALGLLVTTVLADYVLNLPAIPRVVVMLGAFAGTVYLAYHYVARPAVSDLSLGDIAGRLERAYPQFDDRLRSTVDFLQHRNPGSNVLQQRVIEQATRLAGEVNLADAVIARPAIVSVSSGFGTFLFVLILAFGILNHHTLSIIASRLLTPFNAQPWPKSVQIEMTSTIPARVPVGQKIDVRMKLDRGDKPSLKPILYYQVNGGPTQQLFMSRGDDGTFASSLDARLDPSIASGKLNVWIEAGDDTHTIDPITIVPRLTIKQITAAVTPPPYVPNRPSITQDLSMSPLVTAEGSSVAISVHFNKPLGSANPVLETLGDKPSAIQAKWSRPDPQTAVASFDAMVSNRFRVRATDDDGFANTALEEYEIVVKPDTNLTVQLENPRRSDERTADAFVPLQAVVEDDCGAEWVKLVVHRLEPSPMTWQFSLLINAKPQLNVAWQPIDSTPDRVRFRLNTQWELSPMKLTPGDVIEYSVVAKDNFNLNGRQHDPVSSSKLRITIISQDDLAGRVSDELRAVKSQTGLVRLGQQRGKQETQQFGDDTKNKPALDAADQSAAQRLAQEQASTAASTKQLADKVQQSIDRLNENRSNAQDIKDIAADIKDTFDKTSEGAMKNAAEQLSNVNQPSDAANREQTLADAQTNQQKALDQLDHAMAKMENIGSLQATLSELVAILAEQQGLRKENEDFAKTNLGKTPSQLADEDKQKLDSIASRQSKLADRTQQAIDKMSKQAAQMQKSDPSASDSMKAAAQDAQDNKVTQNQQRASQQTGQNQQSNAQQSQQQVELGLEQMVGELKEAQKRELARLQQHLAELQEQIATLVRRQSSHNLDNLLLQGVDKLKAVDPKTLVALTTDAQRQPQEMKPPEPRLLSEGQELTDRNTRDIAKSTDAEPQAAAIGALLTKAAGKMERAIIGLRADKIAEAYDPDQVDALAALIEAKKQVDQQKDDADKKIQQQQKEAIRQRYIAIKAEQERLNVETLKVEKARDASGNIARTQWPTIAKLPKDEATLADTTAKIEDDLSSLGSVVYVWANHDIKTAMDSVHDDLIASKTGVPTQAEQDRIVEQLTAMIDNLKEPPPEDKKFEGGGGGGGGGGQKPPQMPTEVELRLLKALQTAVNTSTVKINAAPTKENAKLASLGGRQGELRNLLDNLLKKASKDQMHLDPAPENKDQLPEESQAAKTDESDLDASLLGEKQPDKQQQKVDDNFKLVGTRMARSQQRLALNDDAGAVTQAVQKKILTDLDSLIALAHKNSQQQQSGSQSKGQQQGQPKPDQAQANNQGQNKGSQQQQKSAQGAVNQNSAGAGSTPHDLKSITETASEWGAVTPRVRQAVIESQGESIVEQYRKIIEDYYGALSTQGSKKE